MNTLGKLNISETFNTKALDHKKKKNVSEIEGPQSGTQLGGSK